MSELGPGIDLALVPIWGWGPKLGPGHLDPETAAEALALIRPRLAIPHPPRNVVAARARRASGPGC